MEGLGFTTSLLRTTSPPAFQGPPYFVPPPNRLTCIADATHVSLFQPLPLHLRSPAVHRDLKRYPSCSTSPKGSPLHLVPFFASSFLCEARCTPTALLHLFASHRIFDSKDAPHVTCCTSSLHLRCTVTCTFGASVRPFAPGVHRDHLALHKKEDVQPLVHCTGPIRDERRMGVKRAGCTGT